MKVKPIPISDVESLEDKYGVALHVDQYEGKKDEFYIITRDSRTYAGSTIKEVRKKLKNIYGY